MTSEDCRHRVRGRRIVRPPCTACSQAFVHAQNIRVERAGNPGIGQLMVDSVSARDIPVVQACALVFAVTYICLNLLADIVAIVTNPRLLHPR